jgi:hypothetical protein
MRPEARLLQVLGTPRWSAEADAAARRLLSGDLDWAYLLDQALRQQVLSLVGRNVTRYRLWQGPHDRAIVPHAWIYAAGYEANRRRNNGLFAEFARVFGALAGAGVRYAVRKGPVLCALVYDDPGIRRMSDLDLLIERDRYPAAAQVLAGLGYRQGVPSSDGLTPYDRPTRAFWSMHLNNALPFRKLSADPDVELFEVDLCFDLFQRRSVGRVDVRRVLDRTVARRICGVDSYALHPLDHLMDLCLHLYKEATSYLSIERGKDLTLQRFLDIAESLRTSAPDVLTRLAGYAAELGAVREVYFALHHTRALYPDAVPADVLADLAPGDLAYLDEYGELDGRTGRWREDFLTRLFNPDRARELAGRSSIPMG